MRISSYVKEFFKMYKLEIILYILFLVSILLLFYKFKYDKESISYYYNIIENQEKIKDGIEITKDERKALLACKNELCYRDFYKDYTLKNGVENAFIHLALVQKELPEFLPGCHYISHGIGHAALILRKNDVSDSFAIMQTSGYFKNIATCGNGYFHGVIEEYAKNAKTQEDMISLLKPVCNNPKTYSNCYHGVGHSAVIQLDFDLKKSLEVCDGLTDVPKDRFGCYTGVFMEIISTVPVSVVNGKMVFDMCDSLGRPYREACYLEQSSLFEWYTKDPFNYSQNTEYCKQIDEDLDRMSCVKLFAIRGVRISHYKDISDACDRTSTDPEKYICSAIYASRIAGSMSLKRSDPMYKTTIQNICSGAGIFGRIYCYKYATKLQDQLFYVSENDLTLPTITWSDIFESYF